MKPNNPELSGILVVNKHAGVTSHDVVGMLRRLYQTRQVGHTGTLDPMATGVLIVLVGRAVKAAEYLVCGKKGYRAILQLGLTTDTQDTTGKILTRSENLPSPDQLQTALAAFRGKISQIPPMVSALKVNGQKLCDLARKGITVERQSREIEIHSLTATPTDTPGGYILDVVCSSGTYIRTLCADIGEALGCGGAMAGLTRTETGGYSLSQSYTVDQLTAMTYDERLACLLPTERLFADCPAIALPAFYEKLCRSGCEIYQSKIGTAFPSATRVRLCNAAGTFFALGEVLDYENGSAVKSIKTFVL